MSSVASRVGRTIRRRGLLRDGDRVAVASPAARTRSRLTWVLRDLERHARWRLAGLIHVNHRLRARESDDDERFCRALADRLASADRRHGRADVRERARERRQSIEAAARGRALRVFRAGALELSARRASRPATRRTIRPRPCCCGCFAAPARAACRRSGRGAASTSGR